MSRALYILQTLPVGRILRLDTSTGESRVILDNLETHPDGIAVDESSRRIYWTNMGHIKEQDSLEFFQADGTVESINIDGSDQRQLVGNGLFVTGKQLVLDKENQQLYWCDREGMRVFRANTDGSCPEVLIQAGIFPRDAHDYTRHCVGIALNKHDNHFYWTQKGPSKGGLGRILRAPLALPSSKSDKRITGDIAQRDDVEVVLDHLPEPIDLEFSRDYRTLFWTDRGDDAKGGNSLNSAQLEDGKLKNHQVIAAGFKETIALALDEETGVIYVSDLSGTIYRHTLDKPGSVEIVASGFGPLTGITLGE